MLKNTYTNVTMIVAERGKYLRLSDVDNSEELIGKPERMVLSNLGSIPEFEEVSLDAPTIVEEVKPVKKPRKTTKKKSV